MDPSFRSEKMGLRYRLTCPQQSMTIPGIFYHPGFMTIRENQSLKIRFTKRFPGMESSIPVTLIMEHSISQNRSVLPLQGGHPCDVCKTKIRQEGKIEKFHQVVDAFIRESKLKNIKTLEELNRLWAIYLNEYYHKKKHDGIAEYYESLGAAIPEEGISPAGMEPGQPSTYFFGYSRCSRSFLLHHEQRKVDKGACISFRGQGIETKPALIGYTVEISIIRQILRSSPFPIPDLNLFRQGL